MLIILSIDVSERGFPGQNERGFDVIVLGMAKGGNKKSVIH